MIREEKERRIQAAQNYINSLHYTPLIPYPYCCVCFERLTADNIVVEMQPDNTELLWDHCIQCKEMEDAETARRKNDKRGTRSDQTRDL